MKNKETAHAKVSTQRYVCHARMRVEEPSVITGKKARNQTNGKNSTH